MKRKWTYLFTNSSLIGQFVLEGPSYLFLYSKLVYIFRNLLLSSRGVDLPHLSQQLERITARRSLQPLDPTPVTDIDAFLKNELENSVLAIVEHTSQKVSIE